MHSESGSDDKTVRFEIPREEATKARSLIRYVYDAMREKGYDPVDQLVGYLVSGDPAYITSHKNARALIRQLERDELLEEIVSVYLERL